MEYILLRSKMPNGSSVIFNKKKNDIIVTAVVYVKMVSLQHLQHIRIAVAFACWNIVIWASPK